VGRALKGRAQAGGTPDPVDVKSVPQGSKAAPKNKEESEDSEGEEIDVKAKFRLNAKNIGLTYPQCNLDFPTFMDLLMGGHGRKCDKYAVGREEHADGNWHYHVYMHFPTKLNIKDPRYFDLEVDNQAPQWLINKYQGNNAVLESLLEREIYHPNIKKFGSKRSDPDIDRWISYCKKEGNWEQHGFLENLFTFKHWDGYRKQKADLQAWEYDAKAQQRKEPFPFELPDGRLIEKPQLDDDGKHEKRRSWLILGPPDVGKSFHFLNEFAKARAYWRPNNKYPYESAAYRQESVIVIDDLWPKLEEIMDVLQVYPMDKQVYGESRYTPNYWKEDQARVIIWLLNSENLPDYVKQDNPKYKIFRARFNILEWIVDSWSERMIEDQSGVHYIDVNPSWNNE